MINKPIIYKILKDFTKHRNKKLNGQQFLAVDLFLTLNTGITDKTFQQRGEQDSSKNIMKSSAIVCIKTFMLTDLNRTTTETNRD